MSIFKKKAITTRAEDIGRVLASARREQRIELKDASARLGIKAEYLSAIEEGATAKLPAGVYRDNYLREYAAFLGIEREEWRDRPAAIPAGDRAFFRPMAKIRQPLVFSRLLKKAGLALLVVLCFAYLGYYLRSINRPPALEVIFPPEGLVTEERQITIRGQVPPETEVTINGETVLVGTDGGFTQKIDLKTGDNGVIISARRKFGRENRLERHILVR